MGNCQCKELMLILLQNQLDKESMKQTGLHSCISNDNEQDSCDSHAHMVHLFKNI